jgi:[ribosomal protein S18]-alanine N-acetyltransferase
VAVTLPLTVNAMGLSDIAEVHEIERLSFVTPWPAYAFEQELTGNRLARYVVARAMDGGRDRVVGFAGIWLMVDEAHVTTFGVHPDWRRRGVGRRMLLSLLELALEIGAARMTLEVRASNRVAQSLYAAFGFNVAGERRGYYTDDGEDALVMTTPDLRGPVMRSVLVTERARRARADGIG